MMGSMEVHKVLGEEGVERARGEKRRENTKERKSVRRVFKRGKRGK